MNSTPGVSGWALRTGSADVGIADNEYVLFSELMDPPSLFLTANADNLYFWGNVNLADGPMVIEVPPNVLGVIDDVWFRWVGDSGTPGPDRGLGGRPPHRERDIGPFSGSMICDLLRRCRPTPPPPLGNRAAPSS